MNKRLTFFIIIFLIGNNSCTDSFEKRDLELFKETPVWNLAKAVSSEHTARIISMLEEDISLLDYQEERFGFTLLHFSVRHNKYESTKLLLEYGANPNLADKSNGISPFIVSATKKDSDFLELLLSYGGDVNSESISNEREIYSTPLIASISGSLENVKLLIEAGADVNYKTKFGDTALNKAFSRGDVDIAKFLLIDANGSIEEAKFIFPNGTEIEIVERMREWTFPLDSYEHRVKIEIADYLKENGYDYWLVPIPKHLYNVYPENYLLRY